MVNVIDAALLAKMFLAGAKNLEAKKEWINELNVFPVPDGDTGTNMCMTIMSAAKEVSALASPDMKTIAKAISSGSLRGARGNSGVILSQLFRGFTKVIADYDQLDQGIVCEAIQRAVETAYKAVMKPKEGTILTVARGAAEKALELVQNTSLTLDQYLAAIVEEAEIVLAKTPDMLPVLKQAGVVDSGGQGLLEVIKGALDAFQGKEVDYTIDVPASTGSGVVKISPETEAEIKFGYCTEFIIVLDDPLTEDEEDDMKSFLHSIGDSIVLVADDEIVKIHVHTNDPGLAIQKALTHGSLSRIKIDNMREEHQEKLVKDAAKVAAAQEAEDARKKADIPMKDMGFISVSVGEGLSEVFKGLGVDYLIEGGQTMNPSTEDMLNAIDKVHAKNIFIFPNNKNIVMAANQAADMTEDKNIIVIPTKTIPQGVTAMINFMPDQSPQENAERMIEEIANVRTGQVTYAVRNTVIDDKAIKEGDFMGIGDSGILSNGQDMMAVVTQMVDQMVSEDVSFITIYYGEDVEEEDADRLAEALTNAHPDIEMDVQFGGQPVYYYIISVE